MVSLFRLDDVAGHGIAVERHRQGHTADSVDVLRRTAVTQLQTVLGSEVPLHAQTGFNVDTGLHDARRMQGLQDVATGIQMIIGCSAQDRKRPQTQSCRQLPVRSQLPVVVQPEGVGPGIALLTLMQQVDVPLSRHQLQVGGLEAVDEPVLLHGGRLLMVQGGMTDEAAQGIVDVEDLDTDVAHEVAVDELRVGVEAVIEGMQPVGRSRGIAPLHAHPVLQSHVVAPPEERQRQHILLRKAEVQSHVGVVEVKRVVTVFIGRLEENIQIGTASRHKE